MSKLIVERRSFIKGLGLLFAAPAIVKAENLMKIASPIIKEPESIMGIPPGNYDMFVRSTSFFNGSLRVGGILRNKSGDFIMDFDQNMLTLK